MVRRLLGGADRRIWLITFALVSMLGVCWSFASPIYSVPDEPAHAVRAYSVAHLDILGREPADPNAPGTIVRVPNAMLGDNPACYAFTRVVPANCTGPNGDPTMVDATTNAGRHPPLYYFVAGLPSWLTKSIDSVYLMRIWSALLCAAVLASAMVTAFRPSSRAWMPISIVVALTPMALYLLGSVNPSSLEIAAGIGVWVSGLALVSEREVDTRVLLRFVVAGVLLILVRQLGPLWFLLAVGALLWLTGVERTKALLRDRRIRWSALVLVLAGLVQGLWLVIVKPLDSTRNGTEPLDLTNAQILRGELAHVGVLYREMIGVFGWRDTLAPDITYGILTMLIGALVVGAVLVGRRRTAAVLGAVIAATVVIPIVLESRAVRTADFFWQGRYTLPLAVGVVLLAGHAIGERMPTRSGVARWRWMVLGVALLVAQEAALWQVLQRFMVGLGRGGLRFWNDAAWSPPVPAVLLMVLYAVAMGTAITLVLTRETVDQP